VVLAPPTPAAGTGRVATLVLAVIRGLLVDLDATGDTPRTDRPFAESVRAIEQQDVRREEVSP
jgi:hypothetical protein